MARYIIVALIAFALLALFLVWVLSGGPRKLFSSTRDAVWNATPSSDDVAGFQLPWQPAQLFPTLDITELLNFETESPTTDPQARLAELEDEYARLKSDVDSQRTFGSPSPYAGKVTIVNDADGIYNEGVQGEYIQLSAAYTNTEPINVTGWVLESALSGARVTIPSAAAPFVANGTNALVPVTLEPGSLALVASAASPVGVSFRENACTGYLGQFQTFTPSLGEECPSPSRILPLTSENLQRYGSECFDAISQIAQCRFPQQLPADISGACRAYLNEYLSYNGCVSQTRLTSGFQKNMWRVFIGSQAELWRNSHDAIRLLDGSGKTVSVFVY